jgi:acyl dehydratase
MPVPLKYAFAHGPVLAALGRVALSGLKKESPKATTVPSAWLEERIPPRQPEIIRDYIKNVGGDPGWYKNRIPASYFPEWGFPLGERALEGLGYPLVRGMNAGCRIENRAPLPLGEPLNVKARIESIDDDGKRAIITQKVITGTAKVPEALVCEMRVFIPLQKPGSEKKNGAGPDKGVGKPKARTTVPADAREIAFLKVPQDAGLDFAKLTGDFNPIHWLAPYAKASGFRTVILHGFGTFARAIEALNRSRFAGDPTRLKVIDARFTRPLVLPARVGVYVSGEGLWVGDAPGGGAYLEGRFETETRS